MIDSREIVRHARSWIGTPFRHQGRNPGLGVDCIGVVIDAMRRAGVVPPGWNYTGYGREPLNGLLQTELQKYLTPTDQWAPGTVLLMRWFAEPQHVGIYAGQHPLAGGDTVIHSCQSLGGCVEHTLSTKWRQRVCALYRIPGVIYANEVPHG